MNIMILVDDTFPNLQNITNWGAIYKIGGTLHRTSFSFFSIVVRPTSIKFLAGVGVVVTILS